MTYVVSKMMALDWLSWLYNVNLKSFGQLRRLFLHFSRNIMCLTNRRHDRRLYFRSEYLVIATVPTQIDSWLCEICFQWECILNKTLLFLCHFFFFSNGLLTLISCLSFSVCRWLICWNHRTIVFLLQQSLLV